MTKSELIALLSAFIAQRPGFEFANYGNVSAYRSDYGRALQQKHDAEKMLRFVELRESFPVENILQDLDGRGRLSLVDGRLEYCTGQYFPTEYRAAVCRLLSSAIWHYLRECGDDTREKIEKYAAGELGRGIVNRWF